jgi:hypothetical protein
VLGVVLPEGAEVDSVGFIRAFPDQPIELAFVEGLLAIDPETRYWAPAPAAVFVRPGKASLVQLRAPGAADVVALRLKPREMFVRVGIAPKSVAWPGPPLRVRIVARTRDGKPLVGGPELRAEVLLGVEPIDVAWEDDGSAMVAEIPPQPGNGPWVVRVQVLDTRGNVLARNFVEVARKPSSRRARPPQAPTVAQRR